jgi:hypothetical protein
MSDQQTVQPPPPGPPGPDDIRPAGAGDVTLERRVERLEDAQMDIRERLVRLETRVDAIAVQMVTKADLKAGLAAMEATLLKWFIGTALALTGIVFTVARLIK